jgi:hypothetical protein
MSDVVVVYMTFRTLTYSPAMNEDADESAAWRVDCMYRHLDLLSAKGRHKHGMSDAKADVDVVTLSLATNTF